MRGRSVRRHGIELMSWDAAGAIGEITGAIAVVATLFYLAKQIRSQTDEARLSALHQMATGFREASIAFTSNDMAELLAKATESIDNLSEAELIRIYAAGNPLIRVFEEAYEQYLHRGKDPRILGIIERYAYLLAMPALIHIWSMRKQHFLPEFREYVDSRNPEEFRTR